MLLILKDTKINLTMFVFLSIYTKALPIIHNYVNSTQRDKRRHFSVCPFYVNSWIIHLLYIIDLTRFHKFSSHELLYLYSKLHVTNQRFRLLVSVILEKHFLCRKEVSHTMIILLFVLDKLIFPIIVGYVLYLLQQEHK